MSQLQALICQLGSGAGPEVMRAWEELPLADLTGSPEQVSQSARIRKEKLTGIATEIIDRLSEIPEHQQEQAWKQILETFQYLLERDEAAWWITFGQMPAYNLFWLMYYLR